MPVSAIARALLSGEEDMTKQEKLKKLLEMQKRFIEADQNGEFNMRDYFSEGAALDEMRKDYMKLAMEIVDDAHKEVGSKR